MVGTPIPSFFLCFLFPFFSRGLLVLVYPQGIPTGSTSYSYYYSTCISFFILWWNFFAMLDFEGGLVLISFFLFRWLVFFAVFVCYLSIGTYYLPTHPPAYPPSIHRPLPTNTIPIPPSLARARALFSPNT